MQFLKLSAWREAIRGLMAFLCNLIYSIMSFFYDLFNNVSQVDLLTSQDIQPIYQRITMIITIVMIFYVTFQFVKYIVQPEGMLDKEKGAGNLVYKIVIIIVLIAFVPKIFQFAYDLQKRIIKTNVISKVILGPNASMEEDNLGSAFASSVFNMFYYVEDENIDKECHDGIDCGSLVNKNISTLKNEGHINNIYLGLSEVDNDDEPLITFEFDGLIAVIVGGFICYILILYCIDVGVRWVQLLYLQLIAPIPIIGYMSPKKDGMFQKWLKQCTTTYLDLFFRVAIINIILLLCDVLIKSKITGEIAPAGSSKLMSTFIYVVLIMGVMLFAHKAPKLLAELFPKGGAASGNFGLKATERVAPEAARVAGMALGSSRVLTGAVARGIKAHRRKKANEPNKAEERKHRSDLRNVRNQQANLARYEKSANVRNQKRKDLDAAGKEYKDARQARIEAEQQGKTGPELDRLKQQEQLAREKATRTGQEYRKASDQMQKDRENYLGKEAIEKEKEERRNAAYAQRDARLEAQRLQQDMTVKEQEKQNATQNATSAQTAFDTASSSLDSAKQNKENAQTRKNEAETKIQSAQQELSTYEQQKQAAEAKLNAAQQNGLTDPNKIAEIKGEIAGIEHYRNQAEQKLMNARSELTTADNDLKRAEQDIAVKEQEKRNAETNLNSAKTKEANATKEVEALQQDINKQKDIEQDKKTFVKSHETNIKNETTESAFATKMAEHNEKERALQSQIAEDVNKRRGTNVVTQALGGAIVGGYYGITEGAKATKLEDIGKKVAEGYKKDIKSMNEVEKYYDNGGTKTWVGRTIDKIENAVIGESLPTVEIPLPRGQKLTLGSQDYKTTQMTEIAPLERKIKEAEASATVESDVKSKVDSAKSRTEDKLEKEEVKVSAAGFKPSDKCKGVDISSANTVSDVYRMYKANADTKQSIADAAAKDYEAKKAAGITGQEIVDAEARARKASQEAQEARFMKEQIKKEATEFTFTQIIKTAPEDRIKNDKFDQVMVGKIADLEQSIANARKNDATVKEMHEAYKNGAITQAEYNAFMSGKFEDYDQIDHVQTALINIANARTRAVSGMKEEKRQLETSSVTQAQKADSEFSGSGK